MRSEVAFTPNDVMARRNVRTGWDSDAQRVLSVPHPTTYTYLRFLVMGIVYFRSNGNRLKDDGAIPRPVPIEAMPGLYIHGKY